MTEEEQSKMEKDILFQIDMQLYDEFNDTIATMNDYLGDIYSLRDVEEVEKAEKEKEIKLLREAVKKLQANIEMKDKVIDYAMEEIHSIVNLGEFIDRNIDNLDTKEEIKQYFYKQVEKVEEENNV